MRIHADGYATIIARPLERQRIAAIETEKPVEIDGPRLGKARMIGDILKGETRWPTRKTFNFRSVQRQHPQKE